jgi:hypothetical protein
MAISPISDKDFKWSFLLKWNHHAANQGNAHGRLAMGSMYEEGMGVPQDNTQAYKWFTLSSMGRLSVWREGAIARDRVAGKIILAENDAAEQLVPDFRRKMKRFI